MKSNNATIVSELKRNILLASHCIVEAGEILRVTNIVVVNSDVILMLTLYASALTKVGNQYKVE